MLILILETSTEKGCAILAENGRPLVIRELPAGPALSKTLALEVKGLIPPGAKIDAVAVGTGPGSYTGVRVGAALGKALAYGWKAPLIGFCSLETFGPGNVLVDARSGGFYALLDGQALLVQPDDVRLTSSFRSPHADLIKKRFAGEVEGAEIDGNRLAELVYRQVLEGERTPFSLNYLAFP